MATTTRVSALGRTSGTVTLALAPGTGWIGQWPTAWLGGLGTPWNTLQMGGTLRLASPGLSIESVQGRWRLGGRADLDLLDVSSRVSTLDTLGSYRLTYKHRRAMMTHELGAHPEHYISDVPHVQYFNPPYALHAAYWHDRFGEPTSAGCINLSPIDAEALFGWSDPQVPPEWKGALGVTAPENGKATTVVVRR